MGQNTISEAYANICPECGQNASEIWARVKNIWSIYGGNQDDLDTVERALARMIRAEHARRPRPKSNHTEYFLNVANAAFMSPEALDTDAFASLIICELGGIEFASAREFRSFYMGLRIRLRENQASPFKDQVKRTILCLAENMSFVPDEACAFLRKPEALLLAIDLFADANGEIPLSKFLRMAAAADRRRMTYDQAFFLARLLRERPDDLIGCLEGPRVQTRLLVRMTERPRNLPNLAFSELVLALSGN